MWISKPNYYDTFRCIAGQCPDSCCKEWEVQVDACSAQRYRALTGPLGDRLREVMRDSAYGTVMTITDGRCPMWRDDGLCRIQAELGEDALCQVCRDFPRLRHDYGDFVELGLELSCPEAARIIFSGPAAEPVLTEVPGGEEPEYDTDAMAVLKATRIRALQLLSDARYSVPQRLALLLLYGCQAQAELDGEDDLPFDPDAALDGASEFAKPGSLTEIAAFFLGLELLTPGWPRLLEQCRAPIFGEDAIPLARYLVERYWLQAVSDYDLVCRVKFIVISCLLLAGLPGDYRQNAQLFSKEIENNIDNVEALLDAAYSHSAFTDDKLLGLTL